MKSIINANQTISSNSPQIALLKNHFPSCFDKHGAFMPHKLQEMVEASGVALSREGYSLNWLGKSYARLLANENVRTLLKANLAHNHLPENVGSNNMLIKGDNLEVLKHLMGAYSGKVKMIYIDPPYNTGSDGFVYADDRKFTVEQLSHLAGIDADEAQRILEFTSSDSNSHSAWLTFMYPRLYLAKQLLRDDGVIFISIDDNEQAQLKLLMDEVFGEENFLAEFVWRTDGNFDNQAKVKKCHEYIVAYCKTFNKFSAPPTIDPSISYDSKLHKDEIRNTIVKNGAANPISEITLQIGFPADFESGVISARSDSYPIYLNDALIENNKLSKSTVVKSGWSSKDLLLEFIHNGFNSILDSKGQKTTFSLSKTGAIEVIKRRSENQSHVISVLSNVGNTQKTSAQLKHENIYFSFPKPIQLIKYLTSMNVGADFLIMDFFAGSGTTAHAVMQLNAEDGGNRQFICVQIDEPTDPKSEAHKAGYKTIYDITAERIKRAAAKIKEAHPEAQCDFGFKQFETIPVFEGYLDEPDELTPELELFNANQLSVAERHSLMLTWQAHDGIALNTTLTPLDLAGYPAYQGGRLVYFIEPDLSLDAIVALLERLDNLDDKAFVPSHLVVFGYLLNSKTQREMTEAVKQYNNRKGIELTLDVRF